MDMNNKLTLDNVAEFIDKNNEKILEKIGTGGSTSISQETGNAITQKSDGIFVQDYSANIASLENRSIIGSQLTRCLLRNSAKQTLAVSDTVKFDTLISTDGMEYNLTNYSIKLKSGTTYDLRVSIHTGVSGASSFCVYDITNSKAITDTFYAISPNYDGSMNSDGSISRTYKCEQDIEIVVKVMASTSQELQYSDSFYSVFEVVEVGRTVLLDPVKTAQEHEVKFGVFTTTNVGALSANTPLVINTIISGNIELNSSKTGIKLEANKKYKISLNGSPLLSSAVYGGVFVYDLTHNQVTTNMICNSTTVNTNGSYFNTGSGTFLETTESLEISVCFNFSVLEVIDNNQGTFNILVEEIKNPVVVEYNSIGFTKDTLWSGYLSSTTDSATLLNPITDYSLIYVEWNQHTRELPIMMTTIVEVSTDIDYTKQYLLMGYSTRYIRFKFADGTTFTNTDIYNNGGSTIGITKVIGIKSKESAGDITTMTTEEVNTMLNDIFGGE